MTHDTPLIHIVNVDKSFQTAGGEVRVLRHVNLTIPKGSLTVIYGASGSGKTTLLNILMGLETPSSGEVMYDGHPLYAMSRDERAFFRAHTMGMVHQTNHWVKSLNVIENVALPLRFVGMASDKAIEQAAQSLRRIGIERLGNKPPSILSGGEQQQVAMARALVNNPAYIVADEPTGNLDSKNGDALMTLLRRLNKESGRTIVLVTHNLEYLSIGDQVLLMEDGTLTKIKESHSHDVTNQLLATMKKRIQDWANI